MISSNWLTSGLVVKMPPRKGEDGIQCRHNSPIPYRIRLAFYRFDISQYGSTPYMSDNGSYNEVIADSFFFCFDLFTFEFFQLVNSQIGPASETDPALDIQDVLFHTIATIASMFYHVNISTIFSAFDLSPVSNPIVEPPDP